MGCVWRPVMEKMFISTWKWLGVERRARMETENNESSILLTWVPALRGTDELDRGPKGQRVEVPPLPGSNGSQIDLGLNSVSAT